MRSKWNLLGILLLIGMLSGCGPEETPGPSQPTDGISSAIGSQPVESRSEAPPGGAASSGETAAPGGVLSPSSLSSGEPEGSSLLEQVRITEITLPNLPYGEETGEDGEQLFLFDYRFAAAPDKDGLCYFAIYDSDVHVNRSILYRVGEGSLTELAQFNGYIAFTSSNRRGIYWLTGYEPVLQSYNWEDGSRLNYALDSQPYSVFLGEDSFVYVYRDMDADQSWRLGCLSLKTGRALALDWFCQYSVKAPVIEEGRIFVPSSQGDSFLSFDLDSGKQQVYTLPEDVGRIDSVLVRGNLAVLTCNLSNSHSFADTVFYDLDTGRITGKMADHNIHFHTARCLTDDLLLFLRDGKPCLYEVSTGSCEAIERLKDVEVAPEIQEQDGDLLLIQRKPVEGLIRLSPQQHAN